MDIQVIISQMAVLFILIAIGYIAGKIKMLTPEGIKALSRVAINISTPATILNSVFNSSGGITGSSALNFLLLSVLAFALFFLVAIPSARLLGAVDNANRGLYTSIIVFGNVGFMGYPVVNAIFGADAVFYAALVNIVFNVLTYSIGIILISGKGKNANLKLLLNATLVASIISFVIVYTGYRAPFVITEALRIASGLNTPCAMLVIGATLSSISFKDVFSKWQLYPAALIKLVAFPAVTWLIFKQFVPDGMLLGVLTVLSGMPVAAAVAMLAVEYGGEERIASSSVFLTTLLSAATIPLVVYVFLS